jgi:hypothetical protein
MSHRPGRIYTYTPKRNAVETYTGPQTYNPDDPYDLNFEQKKPQQPIMIDSRGLRDARKTLYPQRSPPKKEESKTEEPKKEETKKEDVQICSVLMFKYDKNMSLVLNYKIENNELIDQDTNDDYQITFVDKIEAIKKPSFFKFH